MFPNWLKPFVIFTNVSARATSFFSGHSGRCDGLPPSPGRSLWSALEPGNRRRMLAARVAPGLVLQG